MTSSGFAKLIRKLIEVDLGLCRLLAGVEVGIRDGRLGIDQRYLRAFVGHQPRFQYQVDILEPLFGFPVADFDPLHVIFREGLFHDYVRTCDGKGELDVSFLVEPVFYNSGEIHEVAVSEVVSQRTGILMPSS